MLLCIDTDEQKGRHADLITTFFKDYVNGLQPMYMYIVLQVGTITYLIITDNILILHLKIFGLTAYDDSKGNIEEDMF